MFKLFSLISFFSLFCIFNASAIVQQSASSALSYRNVVSVSRSSDNSKQRFEPEAVPSAPQKVDLRNATTKTVYLLSKEKVEITLNEEVGYSWELSYDNGAVSMISNSISDGARVVKFIQEEKQNSTIFFDYIDSEGKTVKNKAVYIKAK